MDGKRYDKMRILLISPFFVFGDESTYDLNAVLNKNHYVDIPLGLTYISSYLKKNRPSIEVEVYDANAEAVKEISATKEVNMEHLWGMVRTKIELFDPDVVGISALFEFIGHIANKFIDLVKEVNPHIITVAGGSYATFSYKQLFSMNKNIDFVIRGEGEKVFVNLTDYLAGVKESSQLNGVVYRDQSSGKIIANRVEKSIEINTIPIPDRTYLDMQLYATHSRNSGQKIFPDYSFTMASVLTSRGCNHSCTFCSTKKMWGNARFRDVESIISEMKFLIHNYNINCFFFPDDNMLSNRTRYIELLNRIIEEDFNIKWMSGGFQSALLDSEIVELSVKSGLVYFPIAFESGSDKTLRTLKKPLTTKNAQKCVDTIRNTAPDAYIFGSWITGLPFETKEDIEKTYKFIKHLDLDWSSIYTFQPYRGTPLYEVCVEKGYVDENRDTITSPIALTNNAITTDNFSSEWLLYNNYLANLDINFINNRNANGRGNIYQAIRDFLDISSSYPTHVFSYYCLSKCYEQLGDITNQTKYLNKARFASKNDKFYDKYIKHFNLNL